MEGQLPAGIMPDFLAELPDFLIQNYGRWVWHEELAPGIYRHLTAGGADCITVRLHLPPNGLLSTASLRRLAGWVERYALVGRRTSRQGFELVGVRREGLSELLREIEAAGFAVGGTGNSLHQIKGCIGYVHCQNGAIDPPSVMKRVGDALFGDIAGRRYPAWLKISVSGCPNQCGAGVEADIGIMGVYRDPPRVDDDRLVQSEPDIGLLACWCPAAAIKPKAVPGGTSIQIIEERCIRCTSCVLVAPEGISMGPRKGAAVAIGGRGPTGGLPPRLAREVFPFIPAHPTEYDELVSRVVRIVEAWVKGARAGERIVDYADRIGWETFLRQVGAEG